MSAELAGNEKGWAQKIRALHLDQLPDDQLPGYTGPVRLHSGFPNTDWVQAAGVFQVRRVNGIYSWHGAVVIPHGESTHDVTALAGDAVIRVNVTAEQEDEGITNSLGMQRDDVISAARYWVVMLMGAGAPSWSVPDDKALEQQPPAQAEP